jgi:hypothetical protein
MFLSKNEDAFCGLGFCATKQMDIVLGQATQYNTVGL